MDNSTVLVWDVSKTRGCGKAIMGSGVLAVLVDLRVMYGGDTHLLASSGSCNVPISSNRCYLPSVWLDLVVFTEKTNVVITVIFLPIRRLRRYSSLCDIQGMSLENYSEVDHVEDINLILEPIVSCKLQKVRAEHFT